MSAAVSPAERREAPDTARRKRGKRSGRETGCWTYIDGDVLEAAGLGDMAVKGTPAPYYVVRGFQRSRNGHTAIVSLYREP